MRPLAFARGDPIFWIVTARVFLRFNEAARFRARRRLEAVDDAPAAPGFNEAARFRARRRIQIVGLARRKTCASMRPLAFARGDAGVEVDIDVVIFASMRPLAFARGDAYRAHGRPRPRPRFNEAARFRARRRGKPDRAQRDMDASMRPLAFARGDGTTEKHRNHGGLRDGFRAGTLALR